MERLSALPESLRALAGGVVAGLSVIAICGFGTAAFQALPDGGKGKNVVAVVGAVTTVLGTIVGSYVGGRVGAGAAEQTSRGAERSRQVESVRLQEALGMLTPDQAGKAMKQADERLQGAGLEPDASDIE